MNIENLAEGSDEFTGNTWKIEENSEIVLIDTGTGSDCWEKISQLEKITKVVITHSHYDHIGHLERIVEKFGSKIYAFEPGNLAVEAEKLDEGESVNLVEKNFHVFHTPGHKDDSICLYNSDEKILFTGDLIFPEGSFGRTDLDEGDRDQLIESIQKIADLDVESFYPGHDGAVTKNASEFIKDSLENAKKRESKY